jgi:glycosyltransferase involved in cell wall biosynthesis
VTFIVASKREAQETAVAVPKVQTRVIGLAVEIPIRFDSEREEWNAPLNLLCACRLAAKKRLDLCIEAVAVLRRRSIPATLHIYGSGEPAFLNSLIELAEACGVADYVTFHGEKGSYEVYDAMSRADFFLLPSDDENFAIAAAEALTAGLPIIVSDRVDAATDLPRSCGTVLREPSPTTIAAAVEEFAMSMDRYRTRDACTQEARFRYSWQGALTAWQSIIRST